MLHPDAPPEVRTDPDAYGRWRVQHMGADEARRLTDEEKVRLFRDEFYESFETPEAIAIEDAELERLATPGAREH